MRAALSAADTCGSWKVIGAVHRLQLSGMHFFAAEMKTWKDGHFSFLFLLFFAPI
jgi:hypothetical protein